jgi:hypothetical protein
MAGQAGIRLSSPAGVRVGKGSRRLTGTSTSDQSANAVRGNDERAWRRTLGPVAWAVLEDLRLDSAGVATVNTSARCVAAHVGIGKDAAARALRSLIAASLICRLPQSCDSGGRFARGSYELRPTAAPCPSDTDPPVDRRVRRPPLSTATRRRTGRRPGAPETRQLSLLDEPRDGGTAT